jgi:hypothetical protein
MGGTPGNGVWYPNLTIPTSSIVPAMRFSSSSYFRTGKVRCSRRHVAENLPFGRFGGPGT